MKAFGSFLIGTFAVIFSVVVSAQTEILTFDDISWTGSVYEQMPIGYGGVQWNNFAVLNTAQELSTYGRNGEVNGVVSPNNVAFNLYGTAAFISDGSFNLNSAYLMAAWNDGLQVEVQGFVGSTLTYDHTYSVGTQGSTLINFNYLGVNEVNFISSGGVPHGFTFGSGEQFGMDNMSITLVPEPSTFELLSLAVLLLIAPRWQVSRK